eukprot:IDg14830t1
MLMQKQSVVEQLCCQRRILTSKSKRACTAGDLELFVQHDCIYLYARSMAPRLARRFSLSEIKAILRWRRCSSTLGLALCAEDAALVQKHNVFSSISALELSNSSRLARRIDRERKHSHHPRQSARRLQLDRTHLLRFIKQTTHNRRRTFLKTRRTPKFSLGASTCAHDRRPPALHPSLRLNPARGHEKATLRVSMSLTLTPQQAHPTLHLHHSSRFVAARLGIMSERCFLPLASCRACARGATDPVRRLVLRCSISYHIHTSLVHHRAV